MTLLTCQGRTLKLNDKPAPSGLSAGGTQRLSYAARVNAIARQREEQITAINSLRVRGHCGGAFIDKAQRLLTYGWSRAKWGARAQIIATVDRLLEFERAYQRAVQDRADRAVARQG